MKKIQEYAEKLKEIKNWDEYLMQESGLPGPRGNLELMQAVAGAGSEEIFTYKINKDNKVFIFWNGKQIMILKGSDGEKFIKRIKAADPKEAQLIMAKATGNFKHGNER